MLKPWLCLLAGLLLAALLSGQNVYPPGFPDFMTVEKTFFERYEAGLDHVEVFKKPEGYFVVRRLYDQPEAGEPQLFWSAASQSFLSLPLGPGPGKDQAFPNRDPANFDRQPCYGYPGWFHDAIRYLEKQANPPDEALYALARAYTRSAQNLIPACYLDWREADLSERFEFDPARPRLSARQEELYRQRVDRAIELYGLILAHNPDFPTPIGPIDTKRANEILDKYLVLSMVIEEKRARAELPRDLYRPFLRENAYNLLQSCPPNAILITWGDNDTYPLLYLQATENVRPDVLVANSSLLNAPFYNRHLRRDTVFGAVPPARNLPQTFYDQSALLYFDADSTAFSPLRYLQALRTDQYRVNAPYYGVYYKLPFNGNMIVGINPLEVPVLPAGMRLADTLSFSFGNYLTPADQTILDWIFRNGWNRPVCFALTCHNELLAPFGAHLVQQGWVYRLYPVEAGKWEMYALEMPMDVETTWHLYRETFQNRSVDTIEYDGRSYLTVCFITALRLSSRLRESGDTSRALLVLDQYLHSFPNTRLIWDYSMIYLAQAYALAGDKAGAATIFSTLLDNYEQNRYVEYERANLKKQSAWMIELAGTYGLIEIQQRCRRVFAE